MEDPGKDKNLNMKTMENPETKLFFENFPDPKDVRKTILEMLYRGQASHLGTNMSAVEILISIYRSVDITRIQQKENNRSRVLISKGHCAAATYATMAHFGLIGFEELQSYHKNGSLLAGHVSHAVEGVEHSTGALGHGLSVAVGCALGLRSRGIHNTPVFSLVGDGEIQEGSIWEALMLAKHLNLHNLVTMVDNNRISSITKTDAVIDMKPLEDRFSGFGFKVHSVDGHDLNALKDAIDNLLAGSEIGVIICNTIKGKGVPFAEEEPIWHYRSLNEELYEEAIAHLNKDIKL
jgi:transketolase